MRARDFEFRYRFWIFGLLYFCAFVPYWFRDNNALISALVLITPKVSERTVHAFFLVATLVMAVAALLRTWATAYLSAQVMKDSEVQSATLVLDGPYRYVRNPLYFGNLLMTLAFAALASRIGALLIIIGTPVFILRLIGREEAQLQQVQGESFRRFCRAVPRLIPSLTPRLPASARRPRWKQAIAGEAMMWGFTVALLIFAVTLKTGIPFFVALALAIGLNFLLRDEAPKASAASAK